MFYIIEWHESDGNDNHISEGFVEAESAEKALDKIEEKIKKILGDKIWYLDGDTHRVSVGYHREDSCPEGEECRDSHCQLDHRSWSASFYLTREQTVEPDRVSYWHSWTGDIIESMKGGE